MKFNKLRLLGFKSFVEPTEMLIEHGLTGVVGPNGCGKSNLVEALRWVMGENSYKNMRASGMDDVIFSGSGNRPARNTAEVSLFLDNSDRTAPAAFNDADELQVTRRIERESGSVYKINGKDVRAKDVQLLFADASTGARSPSMVGQGRIGELISAKPQARRALLEEAAGISGLYSRRHEAELRLRAAESNLDRLEDVLLQLENQLDSLKRQARQANRYRNLSGEIRKSEALLFHLRWSEAKTSEGEAQSALSASNLAVGEKAKHQAQMARDEAVLGSKLPQLRDEEVKSAAILQRLQVTKSQLEDEVARLAQRRTELESRLTQLGNDLQREEQLSSENDASLERLQTEQAELEAQSLKVSETELQSKEQLENATRTLGTSEAAFSDLTVRLADENAKRTQYQKNLEDAKSRQARFEQQLTQVEQDLRAIIEKIAQFPAPTAHQENIDKYESLGEKAEADLLEAEKATQNARQAEEQLRAPLESAERALREVETEARTLKQILNHGGQDLFPAVVEQIKVEPGFEAALGAALGEDLDVSSDQNAPVHWGLADVQDSDPQLPQDVKALSSLVDAPKELSRRLAQIGVVDKDKGEAIATQLLPGQRIVSLEGDLWRWDGLMASAEAPTAAALRLAQKNRLSELEQMEITHQASVELAHNNYDAAKDQTAKTIELELQARDRIKELQKVLSNEREALTRAERAISEFAAKRSALEEAQTRLSQDVEEVKSLVAQTDGALMVMENMTEANEVLEQLRTKVAEDRAKLAEARASFQSLTHEAEARGRRLETITAECNTWQNRLKNSQKQMHVLTKRRDDTQDELKNLDDAPSLFQDKRQEIIKQLEVAELTRSKAADSLAKTEGEHGDASRNARQAIEALSQEREQLVRSEERLNAAKDRRIVIEASIRETLECHPADVITLAEIKPDAHLPEVAKIETKLERQRAERERLGSVNLRADIEQAEIQAKHNEIVSERDDLIGAIAKLRSGVQSLNKEGRERLNEAFEVVNAQFKRLFTHLFGGGTAELQLVESDDPLEAGLEILAHPPGKKPQTMTLLSGGEQALTAMALIFAVFLTNPAPICILDEVDAPLDDHNVERFCNLMDEMVATTQTKFVLITHNPITMARMNRMFGVTMAERGVSQLVSVNLEEAETIRESA